MSLHPGKQVSPTLRLVRMLGRGAMGSVWAADHLTLQSQVAVKFMSPGMAEDEVAVHRFRQEAKAAAEIRSPHVVQTFDHGRTADGQLYIVMELLDGESLEQRVRRAGALRPSECARIVAQVCKALAKAHERGIVHRDIKPSNIFIIDSGGEPFVKLLDFGVAKFSGEEAIHMTAVGNMVGTPAYMSPEQLFHGKSIDHRGDLWSLAVITYFALTGARPFEGKTLGELAVGINRGDFVPPTRLRNDLPPDVDAWFARGLNPDLHARFTNAKDMAQALEQACGLSTMMMSTPSGVATQLQTFPGTSISSPPLAAQRAEPRRWPFIAAGAAAFVIAFGTAALVLTATRAPAAPASAPATSQEMAVPSAVEPRDEPPTDPPPAEEPSAHSSGASGAQPTPSTRPSGTPRGKLPGDKQPAPKPDGEPRSPGDDSRSKRAAETLGI